MRRHSKASPTSRCERRHRRRLCLALVAAVLLPAGGALAADPAAPPLPAGVAATIDQVQAKPRYLHSTWGLEVRDLATGEVLAAQNSDKLFVPGSIMKTFATAAALQHLGPRYRFHTPVYRTGPVRGGTMSGNLVLVASGDFSMGLRDRRDGTLGFDSTPQIDHNYADTGLPGPTLLAGSRPLAGLDRLAREVRNSGIRRVRGDVAIDDRLFQPFGGWPDGLISPVWINENVIDISSTPTRPGARAKVTWRPHSGAWRVVSAVRTGPRGSDPALRVAAAGPGVIRISGRVPAGGRSVLDLFQIPDPASFARTAFIEALRRNGVAVSATPAGDNPERLLPRRRSYRAAARVAERVSPPLSEFTKVILKVSYNRGADLMVCLVAAKLGSRNCEDGLAGEIHNNTLLGAPPTVALPFDGAGSDDRDRTSASAMTSFLRAVSGRRYGATLRAGLPVLGVDGTLATVGKGTPAAGKIQAKTGTRVGFISGGIGIAGAETHVGYIDAASGRSLVFADLIRDIPLSKPTEIIDIDQDLGAIEAAIQQAY
jgi:D-alanyl-D-alanine carboxypeptidase/D-alanyl-D-alanine-endopeptidase (penicillin-binding protein 4)